MKRIYGNHRYINTLPALRKNKKKRTRILRQRALS